MGNDEEGMPRVITRGIPLNSKPRLFYGLAEKCDFFSECVEADGGLTSCPRTSIV